MLAKYFNWLFYTSLLMLYFLEIEIPTNKTRKRLRLLLARHIPRYPEARYIGSFPLNFTLTETGISFVIGGLL